MADDAVHGRIEELAHEEHELRQQQAAGGLPPEDKQRLDAIEVALDRCWDLLRQREARRDAGQDPILATERPAETVEGYLQ
jgi:hypothetical protein